jgi:hypothetical protein
MTEKYLASLIQAKYPECVHPDDEDPDADGATIFNYIHREKGRAYTLGSLMDVIDRSETLADFDCALLELCKQTRAQFYGDA